MRRIFDLIKHVGPLGSTVLIWGRDRDRQGADRAGDPRLGHPARRPVRRPELRLAERLAPRERAVRPRARGLHRGGSEEEGAVRGQRTVGRSSSTRSPRSRRRCSRSSCASSSRGRSSAVGGTETISVDRPDRGGLEQAARGRGQARPVPLRPLLSTGRWSGSTCRRFRERVEDIPLLALHFLEKLTAKSTPPVTEIDNRRDAGADRTQLPGHVRELENAIRAAVAMADGTVIHRDALPATVAPRKGRRTARRVA